MPDDHKSLRSGNESSVGPERKEQIRTVLDLAHYHPEIFLATQEERALILHRLQGTRVEGREVAVTDLDFTFPDEEMGRVSEK